jgi:D-methionine transport system ATP-binding protein
LLRVENLAYVLPYRSILQPLSFEVAAGEMVLLTGASGVGKTLLLRLLNRLTEPSSGHVYVADREYRSIPMPQLRRQVVLVSSEPNLLGMTVQNALSYPLQLQKISPPDIQQRLLKLLDLLEIPASWLPLAAAQLSSEQCQIVAVARSLVLAPRILLWDEPSPSLEEIWWQRLQSIAREQGLAVIVASKQINVVSRVICLQAGQLAWDRSIVDWADLWSEIDRLEQAEAADW